MKLDNYKWQSLQVTWVEQQMFSFYQIVFLINLLQTTILQEIYALWYIIYFILYRKNCCVKMVNQLKSFSHYV